MEVIDTHAHLCDSSFDDDIKEVLNRAAGSGVRIVVAVGESLSDARKNLQLSETHPMIRPAAGLNPTNLDQKQKLVRNLPLSCLIVESDSPVLGPDAEGRNEPANIRFATEAVSRLKGESVNTVLEEVFKNTCRLYGMGNT